MKASLRILAIAACLLLSLSLAHADTIFTATLDGVSSNPPNASPATGFATVTLNSLETLITVNMTWSGLTAPATASHIHGPAGPGVNAAVIFPLTGVAGFVSGSIAGESFAITPTEVSWLETGLLYVNIHTSNFPGGEIRGQLEPVVPEPASLSLMGIGLAGLAARWRRRRAL